MYPVSETRVKRRPSESQIQPNSKNQETKGNPTQIDSNSTHNINQFVGLMPAPEASISRAAVTGT